MEKTNHVEWVDAVRGAGILSVIVFHTGFLPYIQILNPLLASWMLPMFMFTGGWLLKNETFTRQRLFSTMQRLLIPFLISGIISFVGWIILRNIYPQHVLEQPIGREINKWLTGRNAYFNSPLWFIPTYLFASVFMQTIAVWWFRRKVLIKIFISIAIIIAGFLLSYPYRYPIFSYDLVVLFIGMIMMGSIASTLHIPKFILRTPFDLCILILFIIFSLSNGYIDMFQRQFNNEYIYIISAILGTYSAARLLLYGIHNKNKIVHFASYLGKFSMSFMIWHWPIFQWLTYGLFTTGVLQQITTTYTKTSFLIKIEGYQLVILQSIFCCIYTVISIFCIVMIKKVLKNIIKTNK